MSALLDHGLSSPVLVPERPDWAGDYTGVTTDQLVALIDVQLFKVDPLAVNLVVAREIPTLEDIDIALYQDKLNFLTEDFRSRCLPYWEEFFYQRPQDFQNDIRFFRLGMVAQYLDLMAGVSYKEDQRERQRIRYVNPSDLFLNGILDTRQGTCGNMAALHLAIGWRMGWPVSLACMHSHYLLRYDDGEVVYNIEPTATGGGGFGWSSDREYVERKRITQKALTCGSDLRALAPRERLGVFIGLRARHFRDMGTEYRDRSYLRMAERDWLLARYLYPTQRIFYREKIGVSLLLSDERFEPHESGRAETLGGLLVAELPRIRDELCSNHQRQPRDSASIDSVDEYVAINTMEV